MVRGDGGGNGNGPASFLPPPPGRSSVPDQWQIETDRITFSSYAIHVVLFSL